MNTAQLLLHAIRTCVLIFLGMLASCWISFALVAVWFALLFGAWRVFVRRGDRE